jgi:peptidoglycan/xylan/chitin deacetylase (PgdA/CDA1 family)
MLKFGSFALLVGGAVALGAPAAFAANTCGENVLGTSRTITVSTSEFPRIGKEQYQETLRLKDREVVLTFDDGPHREHTSRVLEALAADCVKATFFMLGINVAEAPHLARRAREEGHTVGTHTFSHINLSKVPLEKARQDIELGIEAVTEALGTGNSPAPFFRAPYLGITKDVEKLLYSRGLMVWGIDADSLDWTFVDSSRVIERSIAELEKKGKGILLLHDIKPATARALPVLFSELKRRGFRVVHVVPEPNPAPDASNISRLANKKLSD